MKTLTTYAGILERIWTATSERMSRLDGWTSALTGLNVAGHDKRVGTEFVDQVLSLQQSESLWRGNDIAARIVEHPPREALRQGFIVKTGDKEQDEDVMGLLEDLHVESKLIRAMDLERGLGGSAIFPVMIDDQDDLESPLNEGSIFSIQSLQVFEPNELLPISWDSDPLSSSYGEPDVYVLRPSGIGVGISPSSVGYGTKIHHSRLITFPGIRITRRRASNNLGWGDSALNRPNEVLRDFGIAWSSVGAMLTDFVQSTLKIKGLAELLATDKDASIKNRIKAIQLSRSIVRMTIMDADETFERNQTPVAGLSDLLDRFEHRLAAAANMSVIELMGRSPAGMNSTGESDHRMSENRTKQLQTLHVKPRLERIVRLVLLSADGPTRGVEPDNWSVEFNPLRQPSEAERATTRKTVADTDAIYFGIGALSADEIAMSRWGGDTYSAETSVDFEERERQENLIAIAMEDENEVGTEDE